MKLAFSSRGTLSMLGGRYLSSELKMLGLKSNCMSSYPSGLCSLLGFSRSLRLAAAAATAPFPPALPEDGASRRSLPWSDIFGVGEANYAVVMGKSEGEIRVFSEEKRNRSWKLGFCCVRQGERLGFINEYFFLQYCTRFINEYVYL